VPDVADSMSIVGSLLLLMVQKISFLTVHSWWAQEAKEAKFLAEEEAHQAKHELALRLQDLEHRCHTQRI